MFIENAKLIFWMIKLII